MATRFHPWMSSAVSNKHTAAIRPSTWSAGWNSTVTAAPDSNLLTKDERLGVLFGTSWNIPGTGVSGQTKAIARFVSRPLEAQTISGNVKGQFRCSETNATDNYTLAIAIKVIRPDSTDRGVLLAVSASDDTSATPPEMATTLTNRKLRDSSENTSLALSSLAVSKGDRIVVEVGFRQASTSVANCGCDFNNDLSGGGFDLAEDDTTTSSNGHPWIEFDTDIAFVGGPYLIAVVATPADNGSQGEPFTTNFEEIQNFSGTGDLWVMVGLLQVASTGQVSVGNSGGLSWSSFAEQAANDLVFSRTWVLFDNGPYNGTAPTLVLAAQSGTQPASGIMFIFRAPSASGIQGGDTLTWESDRAFAGASEASGATVTVTGVTPTASDNVILAGMAVPNASTWSSLAGTNWEFAGLAQYRNTAGSDQSMSFAVQCQQQAAASNDVTRNPSTAAAGISFIEAWRAIRSRYRHPTVVKQAVQRSSSW